MQSGAPGRCKLQSLARSSQVRMEGQPAAPGDECESLDRAEARAGPRTSLADATPFGGWGALLPFFCVLRHLWVDTGSLSALSKEEISHVSIEPPSLPSSPPIGRPSGRDARAVIG